MTSRKGGLAGDMCTAPEMIPTRNDPQPWNDPQIDLEMIPTFILVDPEMIPKQY